MLKCLSVGTCLCFLSNEASFINKYECLEMLCSVTEMKSFPVYVFTLLVYLYFKCVHGALNDPVLEHNAFGYFDKIGIPEAKRVYEEENLKDLKPRIVGGDAADIVRYKYQAGLIVSIVNRTNVFALCGGALISSNRVATAGHCWYDGVRQGQSMIVVLGSTEVYSGGTRIHTCEVYTHPGWNPTQAANDVAVVYLPNSVELSDTIGIITLPSRCEICEDYVGETAFASGYGKTGENIPVTVNQSLSEVQLVVISNEECSKTYRQIIRPSNICTSGNGTSGKIAGVCSGDSGGPLAVKKNGKIILTGITSFGSSLGCNTGLPNGYSCVSYYLEFFKKHISS